MDLSKGSIPVTVAAVIITAAVTGTGTYFTTKYALESQIDGLSYRVHALEGADNKDINLRLSAVERQLNEVVNVKTVGDWNGWRAGVDERIKRNREITGELAQDGAKLYVANEAVKQRIEKAERVIYEMQSRVQSLESRP